MIIQIENLHHTYMEGTPFETKVLHGVNLEVKEGELVAIIGPTRSGKSTLVQYMNALFLPKTGRVVIDGHDTSKKTVDVRKVRQTVGLVFQYPEHQLFQETVGKDVAFGPKVCGIPKEEIDDRVSEALDAVGLEPKVFKNRYIFALSGGQKRRAAIAGVLALQPKVMVFDDPTAGLDPKGREEILGTIRRVHEKQGLTVILVSNNLEDVARMAKRVVVLSEGKVVLEGSPHEVFSKVEVMRQIGLGLLQTVEIMSRLKERGFNVPLDSLDADETARRIFEYKQAMKGGSAGGAV